MARAKLVAPPDRQAHDVEQLLDRDANIAKPGSA